jgi:hypothetical protein
MMSKEKGRTFVCLIINNDINIKHLSMIGTETKIHNY